jgi:hypothetical protein
MQEEAAEKLDELLILEDVSDELNTMTETKQMQNKNP